VPTAVAPLLRRIHRLVRPPACVRPQAFTGLLPTVRVAEKGDKRRTIGLHFAAAEAIGEYCKKAGIESGPLFRPRSGPRSLTLANRHMSETAMYMLIMKYLEQLPGSMRTDECGRRRCLYSRERTPRP
jgi:integrase